MAKPLEEMRAELNADESQPYIGYPSVARHKPSTSAIPEMPDFIKNLEFIFKNMLGSGVPSAALTMASSLPSAMAYGNVPSGANPQAYQAAEQRAADFPIQPIAPNAQGKQFLESIAPAWQKITGSHTSAPPLLPEMGKFRFTPDDLRVAAKGPIEDIRNFKSDYINARQGITRDYPTAGSVTQKFIDPLAEKGLSMYESGQLTPGFNPVSEAIKPKGGNFPTTLGSTLPLSEQGNIGRNLSAAQITDPFQTFEQLLTDYPRSVVLRDWKHFLEDYISKNTDQEIPAETIKKQAADEWFRNANIQPNDNLYSVSQLEAVAPQYNSWLMGPMQKYMTTQMGAGLPHDPLLGAVNAANIPLPELTGISSHWFDTNADSRRQLAKNLHDQDINFDPTAPQNINVGIETATSTPGKQLEAALDETTYVKSKYSFPKEKYPASEKLSYDTPVYDLLTADDRKQSLLPLIKQKVLKEMLTGNIPLEKTMQTTPAVVMQNIIKDYQAEQKKIQTNKKAAESWQVKRAEDLPSDLDFPDGSKVALITPEMAKADENMTARDLGQITIDLNQCIGAGCHGVEDYRGHGPYVVPHTGKPPRGNVTYDKHGYLSKLKNDRIEIATLKDPQGVSQATVRLDLEEPKKLSDAEKVHVIGVYLEDNKPDFSHDFFTNISSFGKTAAIENALQLHPEIQTLLNARSQSDKKSISEMKGKNNNEISEKYVPHMVEWLNQHANELRQVRDLDNLKNVHDLEDHYTSIGSMVDNNPHWYSPAVEKLFKKADDEKLLPRFFTKDQFGQLATDNGVDLSAEPPREIKDWEKQTLREELYSVLIKDPSSLYLQDNLQDHFVENLDLLFGDRNPEGQVPLDIHRKLADMLLDHNGKYRDQLISAYGQLSDARFGNASNGWLFEFTEPQIKNMFDIMTNWTKNHPFEDLPTNADFETAITNHPDPFSEIKIGESPWHPTELGAQPENGYPRPSIAQGHDVDQIMQRYYDNLDQGQLFAMPDVTEPIANMVRILMGNQNPNSRLNRNILNPIVNVLLDQDNHTAEIQNLINRLQQGNHFLTEAQAENLLNILISWTERYPLAE
jgi:hypothetical protein